MMRRRGARQQGTSLSSTKKSGRRSNVTNVVTWFALMLFAFFWMTTNNEDPLLGTFLTSTESSAAVCRELVNPKAADAAKYFSTVQYDSKQEPSITMLRQKQAHRDADLLSLSTLHIFNNGHADKTDDGAQKTHRWAGIHFNTTLLLRFAQTVIAPWAAEWNAFATSKKDTTNPKVDYYRGNGMHEGSDPIILHSFIRTFGLSECWKWGRAFRAESPSELLQGTKKSKNEATIAATNACPLPSFTVIDPFMGRMARDADGKIIGPTDVHSSWVEQERLAFFTREYLKSGDLLFIDSSHALGQERAKGVFFTDVMVEYAEVLPRLPPGVFCHVHDIAFPDHKWFYDRNWGEQFILRALLMYNPYFDIVWSGGALNIPWSHLEEQQTVDLKAHVQATRQAAQDAVGEHLHVFEVGKQRPFAGGGSIWIKRNLKPYPGAAAWNNYDSNQTLEQILKNPTRHLAGVADTPSAVKIQQEFLQLIAEENVSSCLGQQRRAADCIVCTFIADLPGAVHAFDLERLSSACTVQKIQHHPRSEILSLPLSFFTSLRAGDTIILANAAHMGPGRGEDPANAQDLATLVFVIEIAPRLASGVHLVLYDGLLRDVNDLIEQKQNNRVGAFLVQAWLTMNDAVEVLWWQDSDISMTSKLMEQPDAPNDHAAIIKIL